MEGREPPTIHEKREFHGTLDHARSGFSVSDQPTPSYMRPAPPTPKFSLGADSTGSSPFAATVPGTPGQLGHRLSSQGGHGLGHGHRRSISQAPDPLPKTDPWRKETGWNWSGCLVYALFLAAYIFYYYVRIRYTLLGGILWYSILILVFELLASSSMVVHGLSLLRVRLPRRSHEPVPAQPYVVRVLVPCYTESLEIVAGTVLAAANADLPPKACRTVYMLDDGKDPAKAAWVAEQGREDIVYISGRVRSKGETNGKACNLNNTLHQLYPKDVPVDDMELVVIFDADMVCFKDFFVKILAELYDPQVAIVLTPQMFHNYDMKCDIFNHSNLIYWQVSLPGLDGWDNVSCTGTNFVIRARAAQEAGWFPTYTLGEDMALALEIQKEGWKGAYVKEYLAVGEVPETIRNAFMQKSRWCKGGMQIFFSRHNAIFARNLTLMQRIVWNTSGWSYICTTITTPVFLVIPVIGVWAGYFPLQFNWWFALAFTIYSPMCYALLYYCRSTSHLRSIYFSIVAAHMFWFAYAKATFNTLAATVFQREIKFKTTEKSVMAATVTDMANKAKATVKSTTSPVRKVWAKVQDVWIHIAVLLVCAASVAVGVVQLVETFDPHTWQSISVLVSMGWLLYNMTAPLMLMWHCAFRNRGLTTMCTVTSAFTTFVLVAIIVIIWLVLPNEYDWQRLLSDSLAFFDAQRSGRLPADNPIPWRGDSALSDAAPNGQSLVGGYYIDGGFVKNGLGLASTLALLAWGMLEYPTGYARAGQTQHGLNTLRWGTDYLLASYLGGGQNGTGYVAQVGSYLLDSQYWDRPERMTMERPAYVLNDSAPGSDLLGTTAAALAASAMVFESSDGTYARRLADTAEILYNAAVASPGLYTASVPDALLGDFPSSGYLDDLAWGAAWLYRRTGNGTYLDQAHGWFTDAQTNVSQSPATPLAWNYDNQLPGAAVLLANASGWQNETIVPQIDAYLDAWENADNGVLRTGSYLSYVGPDGALRNTANVALLARIVNRLNPQQRNRYNCWAEYQARDIVGDARRSYVVGTAHDAPTQPQHRAASCAGPYTTPCPADAKGKPAANPWVLRGALVSGPSLAIDTAFVDSRIQPDVRVSIEYNAGFTGLMAALAEDAPGSYTHCSQGHGFIYSRRSSSPV